ncbi:LysR substrate-binding domain-containing protein [Acuticoccus kandeliae]|uniref:LysR substrate-binding domain-containing protein n=1 Tax=Acuticoccus kandeliae TaxID=2073160 RepID=UPI001FECF7CA|nr:LysR substrate-binding domain-containing protein [Acuticoccus kandeliae]
MLQQAREILVQISELSTCAVEIARPLSTRLRLGIIPSIAPYVLPRILKTLEVRYPDLKLYVREGLTHSLLDDVRHGRLDAAFVADLVRLDDLHFEEVGRDPLLIAVPEGHRLATRKRVRAADLSDEKLLLLDQGHCLRQHVLTAVGRDDIAEESAVSAYTIATLVHMVEAGMGVTLIPQIAVWAGAVNQSRVATIPFEAPRAWRALGLAWRGRATRVGDLAALSAHLRDHCLGEAALTS